jgi:hypothetical protein
MSIVDYKNDEVNETNKTNAITMNLENLTMQYNNLLTSYKQALANYVSYINEAGTKKGKTAKQYINVPGQAYWGTGQASSQSVYTNLNTTNECQALCSTTDGCTGATFNSSQYGQPLCWLRSGESDAISGFDTDTAIIPKGLQLLNIMEQLNSQLTIVNNEIYNNINSAEPIYNSESALRKEKSQILMDNYKKLMMEREKIDEMVNEYQTLDQEQGRQEILINQNYYSFFILLALVLMIIFILYKLSNGFIQTNSLQRLTSFTNS